MSNITLQILDQTALSEFMHLDADTVRTKISELPADRWVFVDRLMVPRDDLASIDIAENATVVVTKMMIGGCRQPTCYNCIRDGIALSWRDYVKGTHIDELGVVIGGNEGGIDLLVNGRGMAEVGTSLERLLSEEHPLNWEQICHEMGESQDAVWESMNHVRDVMIQEWGVDLMREVATNVGEYFPWWCSDILID